MFSSDNGLSYQFRSCYISSTHTRLIRCNSPMSVNECNAALLSVAVHFEFVRAGVAQCCARSSDRQAGHVYLLSKGVTKSQLAGNGCSFTLTPAGILIWPRSDSRFVLADFEWGIHSSTSPAMYMPSITRLLQAQTRQLRAERLSTMRIEAKKGSKAAGKAVAKADLPSKICIVCKRPFTW